MQADKQVLTSVGLAPTAPTMGHAHKHFISIEDNLTGRLLLELRHQTHPARVAFGGGIVEACGIGGGKVGGGFSRRIKGKGRPQEGQVCSQGGSEVMHRHLQQKPNKRYLACPGSG